MPGKKAQAPNTILGSRTLGNISRIMNMPCAVTPQIAVQASVPALLQAFWSIESPDPKHLFHKIAGHSLLCEIKAGLIDSHLIPPPEDEPLVRFLFKSAEWLDRTTWYLFVASVIGDGLFDWTSNIIQLSGCGAKSPYGFNGDAPFGACSDDGRLATLFEWFNSGPAPGPTCGSSIVVPPGWKWQASVQAQGQDEFGVPCSLTVSLENYTVPTVYDVHTGAPHKGGQGYTFTQAWGQGRNETDFEHIIGYRGSSDGPKPSGQVFPRSGSLYMDTYP